MDFSWFNQLPEPIRQILMGAAGDFTGGLAAQVVAGLLGAASYQVRKRFQQEPQQQALDVALAQALVETVNTLTQDPNEAAHFLTLFGQWLGRAAVAGELAQVIDPRPGVELDLQTLEDEFSALGYEPDLLGEDREFAAVVTTFVRAFYNAAASQPNLQGQIEIGLLRGMAERLERLVQTGQQQAGLLQRFHPLDLDHVEAAYLRGLYHKCNNLPLARDDRADPRQAGGPRLQSVYVELHLNQHPLLDKVLERLDIPKTRRRQALILLEQTLGTVQQADVTGLPVGEQLMKYTCFAQRPADGILRTIGIY